MATQKIPFNPGYYVEVNGEVQGPYDLEFIEAMALSGLISSDAEVSRDGKTDWKSLETLSRSNTQAPRRQAAPPPVPPTPQAQASPIPKKRNENWGCLITLAVIIVASIIGSLNKSTPTPQSTWQPPAEAQPVSQTPYQPPASAQPVYQPTTPAPDYSMTGQDGQVYTISNAEYQILHPRKLDLDAWSTKIDSYQRYTDALSKQVESDRLSMDNTSQMAVDNFNLEVEKYNTANANLQKSIDSYNASVQAFNAELERVGTPRR